MRPEELERRLNSIESRLSRLEENISTVALEEFRERMKELEDLQMLLQAEMLQLRHKVLGEVSAVFPKGLKERVDEIERIIKEGVPVKVSEDLEKRVKRLEEIADVKKVEELLKKIREEVERAGKAKVVLKREELDKLREKLRGFEDKLNELADEINILRKAVEESGKILTEPALKSYIERMNKLRSKIASETEHVKEIREELLGLLKEAREIKEKVEEFENELTKGEALLAKIRANLERCSAESEKLEALKKTIETIVKSREEEFSSLRDEIKRAISRLKELIESEIKRSEALREEISLKLEKLKVKKGELDAMKSDLEAMKNALQAIKGEIASISASLLETKRKWEELDNTMSKLSEKSLQNRNEIERLIKSDLDLVKRLDSLSNELKKLEGLIEKRLKTLDEKIDAKINKALRDFSSFLEKRFIFKEELKDLERRIASEVSELVTKRTLITPLLERIEEMERRIEELKSATEEFSRKVPVVVE